MKRIKKYLRNFKLDFNNYIASLKFTSNFNKFSFAGIPYETEEQLDAVITKLYHAVEKGLAFDPYRAGFGQDNIKNLIKCLEIYKEQYGTDSFCYQTAIDTLYKYIEKNKEYGTVTPDIEKSLKLLNGMPNNQGGIIKLTHKSEDEIHQMNFKELLENRHSVRHFSSRPVDLDKLEEALSIAQMTPSACNRQGWKVHVVQDPELLESILKNQNGNRGFGNEFDKLILVTADVQCFNRDREVYQAFIDGGLYSMNLLNALYFMDIASVPLSASLTNEQEKNVRKFLKLKDSEVFILFIGIGNYLENYSTTRSARKEFKYTLH